MGLSNAFPKLKQLLDNNRLLVAHDDSTILKAISRE